MDRAPHIAFLSEHASPVALRGSVDAGGQNVYVDELSRNLAQLGYMVDIFTRRDSEQYPEILQWAPGVRIVHVPAGSPQWIFKDDLWPFMPQFRDGILRFVQRETVKYDLIHGNFWMSGWVATELRTRMAIPVVQIFHALGKTKRLHQGRADSSPLERIKTEEGVIQSVDRIIAQCPAESKELVEDYGADSQKVEVIPSAVNTDIFQPVSQLEARRTTGLDSEDLLVVYVGRMLPRKDVRNVVRGIALLVQRGLPVKLLLVGGETPEPDPKVTPEIGKLQRLADDLGIADRLLFVGKRQPAVLRNYYSAGDVAVTTPRYEPFGLTPLEGMACGKPVVASAVGGITYTIEDGVTGYLVPPGDAEALTFRLGELLKQPKLRQQMGKAGRKRVEQKFTWKIVAERTASLYQRVLSQSPLRDGGMEGVRSSFLQTLSTPPRRLAVTGSVEVAAGARDGDE